MKKKLVCTSAVNNIDYSRTQKIKELQKQINYIEKRKGKPNRFLVEYTQADDCMEPLIHKGDILLINTLEVQYNMNDLFLVMTPDGAVVRNMKLVSHETIQLRSKNANNENFSIEDVLIMGKVKNVGS